MTKLTITTLLITSVLLTAGFSQAVSAESIQDKVDFASSLEETLGHFWALEQNLDDSNAELALIHATHPIAELYDSMKPELKAASPELDAQVQDTLMELQNRANTEVSRTQAQQAIDDAKDVIAIARSTIVGDELSKDPMFKTELIIVLLETSIVEYIEAVDNGVISEMAEFQDGSAFIWRSQQIFDEIRSDVDHHEADEIDELFVDLWAAYDARADPSQVATLANGIIHELEETIESKIEFASSLEETLGHFWALEQNLDDSNAELALIHATHPISELYDSMKPTLKASDSKLDDQVQKTLLELQHRANTDVSRIQAQNAIDDAKDVVAIARSTVVGDYLSEKVDTKLILMKVLLETSIVEYIEAVDDGVIGEMAEFQDGSAFVWRSEVIFNEIKSDINHHEADEIEELYMDLWDAYDRIADPSDVGTLANGIIHEIDEMLGISTSIDEDALSFAAALDETLGHFWALEQNLDDSNAELALIHATHPIAELYDSMKPELKAASPSFDAKVQNTLLDLKTQASTTVSRTQAQHAIDDAKDIVQEARMLIVGDKNSNNPMFNLAIMKTLLETSIVEYVEAISDGQIVEMAEFQDGSAFVWRSQQIFDEIKSDIDHHQADEIQEMFADVEDAYEKRVSPSEIETITGGIIHEIDEILGVESKSDNLLDYVENIRVLLEQTKQEYSNGDTDLALSLATKAYLDNFEFLEGPLIELDQKELMEEVEKMLREELRGMIKAGEPSSKIDAQIDAILEKMNTIATVVPEFGTIAMMVLAVAIISIVAVTAKSRISIRV